MVPQVNTITPKYVKEHSLPVGPITDLMGSKVTCIGLGNTYTRPLGYVIIWVQVDGVHGLFDQRSNSPDHPRLFKLCYESACHPGNPNYQMSC